MFQRSSATIESISIASRNRIRRVATGELSIAKPHVRTLSSASRYRNRVQNTRLAQIPKDCLIESLSVPRLSLSILTSYFRKRCKLLKMLQFCTMPQNFFYFSYRFPMNNIILLSIFRSVTCSVPTVINSFVLSSNSICKRKFNLYNSEKRKNGRITTVVNYEA